MKGIRNLKPAPSLLAEPDFMKQAAIKLPRARVAARPPAFKPKAPAPKVTAPKPKPKPQPKIVSEDMADLVGATKASIPPAPRPVPPAPPAPPAPKLRSRVDGTMVNGRPGVTRPPVHDPLSGSPVGLPPGGGIGLRDLARAAARHPKTTAGVAVGGLGATAYGMSGGDAPEAAALPEAPAAEPAATEAPAKSIGEQLMGLVPEKLKPTVDQGMAAVTPKLEQAQSALKPVGEHLQQYWPGYAAGGLGALALMNMARRRRRSRTKVAAEFASTYPMVAGFLLKCAEEQLSHSQIEGRIKVAAAIDQDIANQFETAINDPYFKEAGMWGDMSRNVGNWMTGLGTTLGGGVGRVVGGVGQIGGRATDAVGLTQNAGPASDAFSKKMDQAVHSGLSTAWAGLSNQPAEQTTQGFNTAMGTEAKPVDQLRMDHQRDLQNIRPDDKLLGMDGQQASGAYNTATWVGDKSLQMATAAGSPIKGLATPVLGYGAASEVIPPALAAVGEGDPSKLVTEFGPYAEGRVHPDAATGFVGHADTPDGEMLVRTRSGETVPESSLQEHPSGQMLGRKPGEVAPPTTASPTAEPIPDQQYEAIAQDPNIPAEQKQEMATEGLKGTFSKFVEETAAGDPEAGKNYIAGVINGSAPPEIEQKGLSNYVEQLSAKDPAAAQDPSFMDQVSNSWANMDGGQKALMVIGGGLGLLGLIKAFSGEGGIGDWLLAILGLGGAAAVGAGSGMMGQGAQDMLGGFGKQITDMMGMGGSAAPAAPLVAPPPAAGQNPNIPPPEQPQQPQQPAGGQGQPDLAAVQQANPWLNQFASGGTDPKALDPGDAEGVITDWVTKRLGMGGKVDDKQMMSLVAALPPELKQQVAAGVQQKMQAGGLQMSYAKPHLQQLLKALGQ